MKITLLGSGSAYGTPMLFNTWGKADPFDPKNHRLRPSLLLEAEGQKIIIDAGPDFREQINKNHIEDIQAIFITHCHYDHIGGIPELSRASKLLGHRINIYAAPGTMQELKSCYQYLFDDRPSEPDKAGLNWIEIPNHGEFVAQGLVFRTFQVPHHNIFSSAFRYKNFAYVTDWQEMSEANLSELKNLDLLIIESNNGFEAEINGHSNIQGALSVINRVKPKRSVLSHLSTRINYASVSHELPQNVALAYDGMIIDL